MKIFKILFLSIVLIGLNSCSSSDDGEKLGAGITSITLTSDATTKMVGETITFTVTDNNGANVTSTSSISVAATTIPGNTFSSPTAGAFQVVATLNGLTSETLTVNFTEEALPPSIAFEKRVLIEDYTGAWCGWCPRVSYAIELVKQQTDKSVVVAIHNGNTTPGNGYDPYHINVNSLANMINLQGYPTAKLNRMTTWGTPEPNKVSQVIALTNGEKPNLGLAMSSTVTDGTINLEVRTKFGKNFSGTKLVVYITENGLILDQVNYTDYYGGADPIPNFEHNHVLRASLTNLLGDPFSNTETVYDNVVTKNFNIPVPAKVSNAANMEFVAFVVGTDKKTINVRKSVPGENQEFEIVE